MSVSDAVAASETFGAALHLSVPTQEARHPRIGLLYTISCAKSKQKVSVRDAAAIVLGKLLPAASFRAIKNLRFPLRLPMPIQNGVGVSNRLREHRVSAVPQAYFAVGLKIRPS